MQFSTLKPNVEIIIFHFFLLLAQKKEEKVQFLHEKYCVELITPHAGFFMNAGDELRSFLKFTLHNHAHNCTLFMSRLHLTVDMRVKTHP